MGALVDVLTVGEALGLVTMTDVGPMSTATGARIGIGGAELNVAVGLQRLGHRACWVGRAGADALGNRIERTLRAEGVHGRVIRDPSAPTGLMLQERRTNERIGVVYYRRYSAGSMLQPHDVSDKLLSGARIVHLTGITPALSASARDTVFHVAERARAQGITISIDINYRSALWERSEAGDVCSTLVRQADVVFGGPEELAMVDARFVGSPDLPAFRDRLGGSEVVMKDGPRGSVAVGAEGLFTQAAYPVSVADPVGAGDAFVAGYLSAMLDGEPIAVRLDRGARAAAFVCTTPGDWEGAPTRAELAGLDSREPVTR